MLEDQQPLDDAEISITALSQPDTSADTYSAHTPLPPRSSRRYTLALRLATAASVVLLALLVLPGSFPTLRNIISNLVPTPIPTLPPGADRFYMDVSVPWTRVFVDGHLVHPPRIGVDAPLKLARGQHLIEWRADPFLPQSCTVSVPRQSPAAHSIGDTCLFASEKVVHRSSELPVQLILLHESLGTLPNDQQMALIEAAQVGLDAQHLSETVRPGELYATGQHGTVTATRPLQATLHLELDKEVNSVPLPGNQCQSSIQLITPRFCKIAGQDCLQLCAVPWQFRQPRSDWIVFAMIFPSWTYTTGDGQFIDFSETPTIEHLVLLSISWDNHSLKWHVEALLGPDLGSPIITDGIQIADDPACATAQELFVKDLSNYSQVRFISGANPAAGCLVVATSKLTKMPTLSNPPIAYYLERFGVLLAANAVAHQLQPQLLLVDAYEQSLARKLAAF